MAKQIEIGPITKVVKSDDEWKKLLTPDAYQILRHEATERAFTHPLHDNKEAGVYHCAGCDLACSRARGAFRTGACAPPGHQQIGPSP